jgi:hypothetical protein
LPLYATLPDREAVICVVIVKSGQFPVVIDFVVVATIFLNTVELSASCGGMLFLFWTRATDLSFEQDAPVDRLSRYHIQPFKRSDLSINPQSRSRC